jgi:hypothetical protein
LGVESQRVDGILKVLGVVRVFVSEIARDLLLANAWAGPGCVIERGVEECVIGRKVLECAIERKASVCVIERKGRGCAISLKGKAWTNGRRDSLRQISCGWN